jgi:hypothetical protein
MPKSTSMSVDNSGSMDPESHRGTTSQEWPFYPTIDRKAPFDEPPIDAAGTGPVGASSQQLRTRDPHFKDHRTPTVPIPASSSHQMTANRKDFEAELDIRPRDSQVRTTLVSSACARDPHRQPFTAASFGADNSQSVAVHPTPFSNPTDISASKEALSRVGRHEAVMSPGPILSTKSIQPTTGPSPVKIPPPPQNAPSLWTSQETCGDAISVSW